jgi:aerobic carbon-monoxide dehydrogenase medium subunit
LKPPPFAYHAPDSLDAALELLASRNGTRVLAGGQSLVQAMKFRTERPSALVDINRIHELEALEVREGELHIGALVRQQALLEEPLVADGWPLLAAAARFVGYRETRRRGTVAGSLAFAAPWGELTAAVVALDVAIDVRSARGERSIRAREFFRGPHQTALEPGEVIVSVRVPRPPEGAGTGFHEVSARHRDYAQLAAAAVVSADGAAELVLLCAAPTPLRLDASAVVDNEDAIEELLADIEPLDDVEASAAYRRRVAPVLARRALRDAAIGAGVGAAT